MLGRLGTGTSVECNEADRLQRVEEEVVVGTRFDIEAWVKSLKLFYADIMVVVGGLEPLLFLVPPPTAAAVAVLLSPTTMTLQFDCSKCT